MCLCSRRGRSPTPIRRSPVGVHHDMRLSDTVSNVVEIVKHDPGHGHSNSKKPATGKHCLLQRAELREGNWKLLPTLLMVLHRIDTGYSCDITTYWSPSHCFTLLLHSEIEGWFSSWPKNRREFFASVNAFPVTLVPVFYISNRNISRYLSCSWKYHERYKSTKNTKKKDILLMVHDMLPVRLGAHWQLNSCGD